MAFGRRTKSMNSSSYIGSGNQSFVFNRRPKKAFEKIRQVYGEHIIGETGFLDHTSYGKMSREEKEKARFHVMAIIERQRRRQRNAYVVFAFTCLTGVVAMILIMNSTQS